MKRINMFPGIGLVVMMLLLTFSLFACGDATAAPAASIPAAGISVQLPATVTSADTSRVSDTVRIILILTLLSLGPAFVMTMTAFVRIVIVLAMVRHAFGMPETPPTPVLIGLALFLTAFVMLTPLQKINDDALQPLIKGTISIQQALDAGAAPVRDFMLAQVNEKDLQLMYELSKTAPPETPDEVSLFQLTPAFILNEFRVAFQIGFVILLPFLLIDLVVSSILLALGMLMVPPATIALPLKVLLFVLIDGWGLILRGLLGSFR